MVFEKTRLADCCIIKPPKSEAKKSLSPDDKVSFVPMKNLGINRKSLLLNEDKKLSDVSGSYTYFAEDDVLLAKITPCFENGKLGIATGLTNRIGFGSSEFIVFRPKETVEPHYLYYYLLQPSFRVSGQSVMTGAVGHKRVPKDFIENTEIPLPPIPEQKRIVAILDQAFADIEQARTKTEQNLKNARELFESYLQQVFGQRGEGWVEHMLGDVCTFKHGFAFKSEYFTESSDLLLLTPGNFFEEGGYRDRGEKQKYYAGPFPKEFLLKKGALLVAMTEQAAGLLGSPALVPTDDVFLHNQRLGLVEPTLGFEGSVSMDFMFHLFNTKYFRAKVQETASGVKVRHTSPKKMQIISVWLPANLAEQERTARKLSELKDKSIELKKIYKRKMLQLEELKKSTLQKAFSGELTRTDAKSKKQVNSKGAAA
jgi:type I restriction enzyme, S subunit